MKFVHTLVMFGKVSNLSSSNLQLPTNQWGMFHRKEFSRIMQKFMNIFFLKWTNERMSKRVRSSSIKQKTNEEE